MDVGKYFPYEQKELTRLETEFRLKVNLFYRFVPSRPSCHSEAYLLPHTPASPREWWLANAVGAGLKRRGREGKKEGRSTSATSSITVRYNWGQRERKDDAAKEAGVGALRRESATSIRLHLRNRSKTSSHCE